MGLFVARHLHAVLRAAQEPVGGNESVRHPPRNPVDFGQHAQDLAGGDHPQTAVLAAPDQLVGLGEEFDFADTAPAELEIVSVRLDAAAAVLRIDLSLDVVQFLNGGEVEVLPPYEACDVVEKGPGRGGVRPYRPRLDERGPLPGPSALPVVVPGGRGRYHQRGGAGIGAQAQVDPKHIAVRTSLGEESDESSCEANQVALDVLSLPCRHGVRLEEKNEIDIR